MFSNNFVKFFLRFIMFPCLKPLLKPLVFHSPLCVNRPLSLQLWASLDLVGIASCSAMAGPGRDTDPIGNAFGDSAMLQLRSIVYIENFIFSNNSNMRKC